MEKHIKCYKILPVVILLLVLAATPAMADRSNNNHKKEAELKSSLSIKGKVDLNGDKVDYYQLKDQEGDQPRFNISGTDYVLVYVYDDDHLKGTFKKCKKGKRFNIKGTCTLKVVAKQKSKDNDDIGGGSYKITIKP